ncbi:LysR family transcriptional regulator [Rhodococcus wratislaviensis]|uniref:LysR family transcriptional regulator n=1 Tax=Rhodococcus wratislaviensis TaxID=44752 RepID=UPI00365519EE
MHTSCATFSQSPKRAAAALYLAQPSLSQAIRTLERRLGTELFDRSAHPVCMTAAGERFAPAARELLADLDRARLAVHAVRDLQSGRLDIVTHAVFSVEPLVELVHRFRKAYDNILVNVLTAKSSEDARELVRHGAAELAIGYEAHDTEGRFERGVTQGPAVRVADRHHSPRRRMSTMTRSAYRQVRCAVERARPTLRVRSRPENRELDSKYRLRRRS